MFEDRYEDFCKEKRCFLYSTRVRVNSVENPSDLIIKQRQIIEAQCRQKCPYTEQEFREWLETKQPFYSFKKLFNEIP